jgi:hypothetical protein
VEHTFEREEDKEGKIVTGLCGVAYMVKEAKVIIRPWQRVS